MKAGAGMVKTKVSPVARVTPVSTFTCRLVSSLGRGFVGYIISEEVLSKLPFTIGVGIIEAAIVCIIEAAIADKGVQEIT
jgi:hypothetical protein